MLEEYKQEKRISRVRSKRWAEEKKKEEEELLNSGDGRRKSEADG